MKRLFPILTMLLVFQQGFSQNRTIDSLKNLLNSSLADTVRVKILDDLCWEYKSSDPSAALDFAEQALAYARKCGYSLGEAAVLNSIGAIYEDKGEYHTSLNYYLSSLKIRENLGNKKGIAACLNNIGNIYSKQKLYDNALVSYQKALKVYEAFGEEKLLSPFLNNIAIIYRRKGDINKSLEYHFKALKIREKAGNQYEIAQSLSNIGNLYNDKSDHKMALKYYAQSIEIRNKIDDKNGLTTTLNSIGAIYIHLNQPDKAYSYVEDAIRIGREVDFKEELVNAYQNLSKIDSLKGNFKQAYISYQWYSNLKDSVFNSENSEQLAEMQTRYETEKKEKEIRILSQEKSLQQKEIEQQTTQRNGFIGGFALMLALAGVSYRSYRNKRKAHAVIEKQKVLVEEKNKDILDSINYAKRIQEALLKEEKHVSSHLPEHFILFKPKDIVSGDFYWSLEKQGHLYLAAVDCTGHGVPGAFMSMLGIAFLNEITASEKLITTAEILEGLREKIIKELRQTGKSGESKDGMDISLIRLSLLNQELQWSGANNPLWIINEARQITEIKADKQPIGYSEIQKAFTTHTIAIQKGDTIYLFTDGYADQFGGEKGKKFKYAKLKELLLSIRDKTMNEQKEILNETFETWKGNLEQVDDVCVIGIKV